MTTATTLAPRHARTEPRRPASRLWTILGLARCAWYLLIHPSAPLPTTDMNVRVPAGPREVRLVYLADIADGYRTEGKARRGCLVAERRFGPVVIEAHVNDLDYTRQLAALKVPQTARPTEDGAPA
jgi:hypothetical protein